MILPATCRIRGARSRVLYVATAGFESVVFGQKPISLWLKTSKASTLN
jgi:hypothetical protein